jgi:hypothetical protein
MGQWNTLHLFDEDKFYKKVVDSFKNDSNFLKGYFNNELGPFLIEAPETFRDERIEEIMKISKRMSEDFKNYPELIKYRKEPSWNQRFFSQELEDMRKLLFIIVFSNCALSFPYFKLGYRLMTSYIGFEGENTDIEKLVHKIKFNVEEGGIFPGEMGIRNWLSRNEVVAILENYDNIKPNLSSIEARSHNNFAKIYVDEFKEFLKVAKDNGLGLISCLDADIESFKKIKPVGERINWERYNLNENLIKN